MAKIFYTAETITVKYPQRDLTPVRNTAQNSTTAEVPRDQTHDKAGGATVPGNFSSVSSPRFLLQPTVSPVTFGLKGSPFLMLDVWRLILCTGCTR